MGYGAVLKGTVHEATELSSRIREPGLIPWILEASISMELFPIDPSRVYFGIKLIPWTEPEIPRTAAQSRGQFSFSTELGTQFHGKSPLSTESVV